MIAPREPISSFLEEVRPLFNRQSLQTFWDCATGLRRLVSSGLVEAWFNAELRRLVADQHYLGTWQSNDFVLHEDPECVLSITFFDAPQRYIHVLPYFGMYIPLRTSLTCDRYELPSTIRNDVFDPALRLQPAGTFSAAPGETLLLESDRYAYDLKISSPQAVLRFVTRPIRTLEWLFSRSTLQAWQANDADLSFTQLRIAAHVLGKVAHQSSINPLRQLASHPHHAVRWAAIQNLGRLNRSEAIIKIREALHDVHPHVRRAAQKTLERLEGKAEKTG